MDKTSVYCYRRIVLAYGVFIQAQNIVYVLGGVLGPAQNIVHVLGCCGTHEYAILNQANLSANPYLLFHTPCCRIALCLIQFAAIAGAVYPDEYQAFLSKLSPINLDIGSILSFSCIAETNFYDRLLLTTIIPLVLFAVLAGTYAIAIRKNGKSELEVRSVQHKHLSAALFVMFFVYSSVSFTVFQTFVCDLLDDGVDYLRADYSLSCRSDQHVGYVVYASVMVLMYPIGIPAAFAWWLARNRRDLTKPGRETVARLQPFSGLWAAYRPSRFYYEVVECGRRIALTGIAVFVLPGSAAQIAVVLLLAVVFSFISETMRPFNKTVEMGLYRWGNGVVLASMYVALLRKADVSADDTPAQSAFAGVLIAANVFMVVAVLVQSTLFVKEWHAGTKTTELGDPCFRSIRKSSVPCMQVVGDADEAKHECG